VYNDLLSRGYNVYVGKMDNREIDFVAEKINEGERVYVQVCTEFRLDETFEREFKPLCAIKDHHHKYVVTLDRYFKENIDGVAGIHLKDFLLKQDL
jgi:predicted AAA+ superfamily ATPase